MKVSSINTYSFNNQSSVNCKANLWVDKSVEKVVKPNKDNFLKAVDSFGKWLETEQKHIPETMHIRKNTSYAPKVAFERMESVRTFAYPHEESGYTYQTMVKKHEDLEFELGNRKSGFWFDPESKEDRLLSDFKNMFNYLLNGKK